MATQTHTPEGTELRTEAVSADPIFQLASGFMAAKHLFAASELGLFEALADSPTDIDGLAARTGLTRRAARISADAMVALGLLDRDGDTYRNGPAAAAFLCGSGSADLRPLLRLWDTISYPAWCDLASALARGPAREAFELGPEQHEIMSAGIEAHNVGPATALAKTFDFSVHRRLLDVGGGTGSWSIAIVEEHRQLEATVLDLPAVAQAAAQRIADAGLESRVDVISGDAMAERLPADHDVFLLANVAHYWSPEQNRELLRRVREVAEPDSRLLVVDFWTNATHTEPLAAALMAGEFAVHLQNGDVYSVDEIREWLEQTGWRFVEHSPLGGPQTVVVAAVDPEHKGRTRSEEAPREEELAMQMTATTPYTLLEEEGLSDVWFYGGARIRVKTDGTRTGGRLYQAHLVEQRGSGPPLHIHHNADETFYVVEGEVDIVVGDVRVEAAPGDFVFGPRGVPHAYVVRSEEAELFVTFAPASMDGFFEQIGGIPVVPGEAAPAAAYPDPAEFTGAAAGWGVEIVGPPLTIEGGWR